MEQFVLDHASVYNNICLNTHVTTKQELLENQVKQISTHQTDPLKKETYKKLFAKADFLVDKNLLGPRVKLPYTQILNLDGVKLEFLCQILFNNFEVKTETFQRLTLQFDAAGTSSILVLNRNARPDRTEVGPLSKNEREKLPRLYTHCGADFGSVRILVEASNLAVSKVRQFLLPKSFYTKFTSAERHSRDRRHLLNSKMSFGGWTKHALIY